MFVPFLRSQWRIAGPLLAVASGLAVARAQPSTPPNVAPTASDQWIERAGGSPVAEPITLAGHDPNGDALTYVVESNPSHGLLYGTGARLEYVPDIDFTGLDTFTYRVSDGSLQSAVATVTISIREEPCTSAQIGGPQSDLAIHVPSHLVIRDIAGGYSVRRTGAWFSENSSFDPSVATSAPWRSRNDVTNAALTVEMGSVSQILPPYTVSLQFVPAAGDQNEVLFASSALEIAQAGSVIEVTVFDEGGGSTVFSDGQSTLKVHSCNHIAVVVEPTAVIAALNGEALNAAADNSAAAPLTDDLNVGPFAGRAWDLRVYSRALDGDELLDVGGARCGEGLLSEIQPGVPNYHFATYYNQWWTDTADYTTSELEYYAIAHDMAWERSIIEAELYPQGRLCEFFASSNSGRTDVLGNGFGFVYMFSHESPMRQNNANYWLHENFHRWQARLEHFAGHLGGKLTLEATADWGAYHAIPGEISSLQGYFTLVPHLALWTRENSPLADKYMYQVKGGSQYGLGSFLAYLTQEIVSSDFIGRMFDRPASSRIAAAYDLLAEQGHDMAEVYADYAARAATWDMLHGEAYALGEAASASRAFSVYPELHGLHFKIAKHYDERGTGSGWAQVPSDLKPQSWAHNTFKVEANTDADYQVAVEPLSSNPSYAAFEGRVVVFDPRTEARTYYAFDIVGPGQASGMTVPVTAGQELYLVVASVPAVFDQSTYEDYDYRYSIYPVPEPPPATPPVKVYLMAGQSNMEGNNTDLAYLEQSICHADPSYSLAGFACGSTEIAPAFVAERFVTDQAALDGYQAALRDPRQEPAVTATLGQFLCRAGVVSGSCTVGSFDLTDRMFASVSDHYWDGVTHGWGYDGYRQMAVALGLSEIAAEGHLTAELLSPRSDVSVLQFQGSLVAEQTLTFLQTNGALEPGFGAGGTESLYGPELMFGQYLGDGVPEDVLLLKVVQGGTDLRVDWKTPCSVALGTNQLTPTELAQDSLYDALVQKAQQILDPTQLAAIFPQYAGREAQIAGFVWFQGFNDGVGTDLHRENYEENLRCLVRTLREDLGQPRLPTVITQSHVNQAFSPVQVAQALIASETPFAELAVTEDLSQFFHYDSFAQLVIGQRMARAASRFFPTCSAFPCPSLVPTFSVDAGATPVVFDASGTSGLGIVAYDWSFGDGSHGSGQTVSHAFSEPGDYRVSLTTTNQNGVRMEGTQTVSVRVTGCTSVASDDTTCDGIDDDCDGQLDEDASPSGGLDATCDGLDDDCDGQLDEDASPSGGLDVTCDGIDDDCDGQFDEDFGDSVTVCGFAACASEGRLSCTDGDPQDSCVPSPPPGSTDAICDGIDDDCDGVADDDYPANPTSCGIGACERTGATVCVAAAEVDTCAPGLPSQERLVCDTIDNDCDGLVDEDASPLGPTDASCDSVDDDCDGVVDEDYVSVEVSCGVGACFATTSSSCVGGVEATDCTPGTPAPDDFSCDGVDDDCDGSVDEDGCVPPDAAFASFFENFLTVTFRAPHYTQHPLGRRIVSTVWDFGDGTGGSIPDPTHTFPGPGDYLVSFTVTDEDGLTDTATQTISLLAASAADCPGSPYSVSSAGELNSAILCARAAGPGGGVHEVHVQNDIPLTASLPAIRDSAELQIYGNGHVLSASGEHGVRLFEIERSTVTIDDLAMTNGNTRHASGILSRDAHTTLNRCQLTDNVTNVWWGQVELHGASRLAVSDSVLSGASGAVVALGSSNVEIIRSDLSGSTGRLLSTWSPGGSPQTNRITVEQSTLRDNHDIVFYTNVDSSLEIRDSTVSGNSGSVVVAFGQPTITIERSTISNNFSDLFEGTGTLAIGNTMLSGNWENHCNFSGSVISLGHNLETLTGNGACLSAPAAGDVIGGQADLGRLADNGGNTLTHLPGPNSEAILGGLCEPGLVDQTGTSRPEGACTIGALEVPIETACQDGLDDDGDGLVDCQDPDCDGIVLGSTTCGVGACGSTGTLSCVAGVEEDSCTPGTPASNDATCNGLDDDCDGASDEDYAPSPTSCGVGACGSTGTLSCVAGVEEDSCTPGAPASNDATCNGLDDDCDGASDEDYAPSPTSCGVGACAANGTLSCVGGLEVDSCTPSPAAVDDVTCDMVDDDCDGLVDEDYISLPMSCGTGACESTGVTSCVLGGVVDNCVPGTPAPDDSTCDSIDDDCDGTTDEDCVQPSVLAEAGLVIGPATGWTTVTLQNTYSSPVVVTTPQYTSADAPRLVRVRNAAANSFEVQVAAAGPSSVTPTPVHYLVVEEGVYDLETYGVKLEAVKYLSTVTDENNSWVGEARTYQQVYTAPVVLGQVMSAQDPSPSVFWAQGSTQTDPPDAASLRVGKTVNEDPNTNRADETVGYVVFEAGSGLLSGRAFTALLGSDSVAGMDDAPPYNYGVGGLSSASVAVMSLAGMDGGNGGWAVLYGDLDPSGTSVAVAVDEDMFGDSERSHTTEQVAAVVFEADGSAPPNYPPEMTDPGDQLSFEGAPVNLAIVASDRDSDSLSYSASGLPAGLSINVDTGVISGTVPFGASSGSPYLVTVQVDDGSNPTAVALDWRIQPIGSWFELQNDDFESGWGNWTDGGSDCRRSSNDAAYAHQGTYSVRIRDNSGSASSFFTTQGLDVTSFDELQIEFWYRPESMESGEDFLVEFWDGSTWHTVGHYVSGADFTNGSFYNPTITIDSATYNFGLDAQLRFRCDASADGDRVYIDEVQVSAR